MKSSFKIDNKKLNTSPTLIAKGYFSRFFEIKDKSNKNQYFLATTDNIKEAYDVESMFRANKKLKHFPNMTEVYDTDSYINEDIQCKMKSGLMSKNKLVKLYRTERYEPLVKDIHNIAYKDYQELRRIYCWYRLGGYLSKGSVGTDHLINKIQENQVLSKSLKKEVLDIWYAVSSLGSEVLFEISPRNVKVNKKGELVLLDCFFDGSAIKR